MFFALDALMGRLVAEKGALVLGSSQPMVRLAGHLSTVSTMSGRKGMCQMNMPHGAPDELRNVFGKRNSH